MMLKPHQIRIDCDANAGYVQYANGAIARTVDVWEDGQVAADYDANGQIIGIEILGFDDATLEQARCFAQEHDLGFPSNLRGNLLATR